MLNLGKIAEMATNTQAQVNNSEVTMDMLNSACVKRVLTTVGFHNFKIENIVNTLPRALAFEGKLVDDDDKEIDSIVYTMTLRPFGDCVVFKTMLQDIIDQTNKNITLENVQALVGETVVVHVGENARGYAVYHYNTQWLTNQYVAEMNATQTQQA